MKDQIFKSHIFTCTGHIKHRPRVVSKQTTEQVIKTTCLFNLKVYYECDESYLTNPSYRASVYHDVERSIQSIFEHTRVYTNQEGVLIEFHPPDGPWWIEITNIAYQKAGPNLLDETPANNPITIEGESVEVIESKTVTSA